MTDALSDMLAADERCLAVAEVFLDSVNDHPSPVGHAALEKAIDEAKGLAARFSPGSSFEALLVRHMQSSWNLLEIASRYRYAWPRVPVGGLIEALAGEGALQRLQEHASAIDPQEAWAYLEFRHRYREGRVPAGHPQARPLIEACAARLAAGLRDWIAANDWDLPGTDAEVVVGADGADHSWYQPRRHLVVLGGAEFMVFETDGDLRVSPVVALHSLAHELVGHAVQDALSRELPSPLQPDDRSRLRFATLPVAEGFSIYAATLAQSFAKERGADVGMTDADIEFLSRMNRMTGIHHALPALVSVTAARARQEPGFDAVAFMSDECGLPGFGEMLEAARDEPAYRLIYDNACFFGADEVRRTATELNARGVNRDAALRALGSGAWALNCYREAVLERVGPPGDSAPGTG